MNPKEFFKDWYRFLDMSSLNTALQYVSREAFYPQADKVFKAFTLCKALDTSVILLGQDPYPQKGVATGIAFGNSPDTPEYKLSPSLQVLKEAAIDYTKHHGLIEFDNSLEHWGKQGVLLLNSSLTVKPGTPNSHSLYWRPFISAFLKKFSEWNPGAVFVLFGSQAKSFRQFISPMAKDIFEAEHPSAVARKGGQLPLDLFPRIAEAAYRASGVKLQWYKDLSDDII